MKRLIAVALASTHFLTSYCAGAANNKHLQYWSELNEANIPQANAGPKFAHISQQDQQNLNDYIEWLGQEHPNEDIPSDFYDLHQRLITGDPSVQFRDEATRNHYLAFLGVMRDAHEQAHINQKQKEYTTLHTSLKDKVAGWAARLGTIDTQEKISSEEYAAACTLLNEVSAGLEQLAAFPAYARTKRHSKAHETPEDALTSWNTTKLEMLDNLNQKRAAHEADQAAIALLKQQQEAKINKRWEKHKKTALEFGKHSEKKSFQPKSAATDVDPLAHLTDKKGNIVGARALVTQMLPTASPSEVAAAATNLTTALDALKATDLTPDLADDIDLSDYEEYFVPKETSDDRVARYIASGLGSALISGVTVSLIIIGDAMRGGKSFEKALYTLCENIITTNKGGGVLGAAGLSAATGITTEIIKDGLSILYSWYCTHTDQEIEYLSDSIDTQIGGYAITATIATLVSATILTLFECTNSSNFYRRIGGKIPTILDVVRKTIIDPDFWIYSAVVGGHAVTASTAVWNHLEKRSVVGPYIQLVTAPARLAYATWKLFTSPTTL